ncbi:unnamed protein product [Dicrocoelium dendriticum]|nr:unnamed protein product [Dicrocoelium dendriticum]
MIGISFLAVLCFTITANCKIHKVNVTLQTSWVRTPAVAEISEYLADWSLESFWKFVNQLEPLSYERSANAPLSPELDFETYLKLEDLVLRALQGVRDGSTLTVTYRQIFRLFFSSRSYSPAVEMSHQVAMARASQLLNVSLLEVEDHLHRCTTTGSTWAQVGDQILCHPEEIFPLLEAYVAKPLFHDFLPREKLYGPKTALGNNLPTVIIYGDLSQRDFYTWHKLLKSFSETGLCIYAFRHYFKERPHVRSKLVGYGVELALKSMEYKAMDDAKVEATATESTTNEPPEESVVQGFNFTQLEKLHPELTSELKAFRDHLVTTDDELHPIKAWQFRDFGFQASQAVVNAAHQSSEDTPITEINQTHSGLVALRDISQNLPSRASRLISTTVSSTLRDEVAANQMLLKAIGINPGQSVLFVNGLLLSPSVDVFALLDVLREESKIMSRLHNLGIPGEKISDLLIPSGTSGQLQSGETSSVPGMKHSLSGRFALDISSSPILYINNLEADPAYAYWPDLMRGLFVPDFLGGIPRIRKNLYHVVLVVDPASPNCIEIIRLTESFLLHKVAVRFGFLWSIDPSINSPSLMLVRIFNYISSSISHASESPLPTSVPGLGSPGAMAALSFLTELYSEMEQTGGSLTMEFIQRRFEKLFPNAYVEDITSPNPGESDYDTELKLHEAFLRRSGLYSVDKSTPLILFNGVIFDVAGMRKMGGFEDSVVNLCLEELVRVQHAVYHGQMTGTESVFTLYEKGGSLVSRFNARVLSLSNPVDSNHPTFVDFGLDELAWPKTGTDPSPTELLTYFVDHMRYFQKGDLEAALRPVTIWVVIGDLDHISTSVDPNRREELRRHFALADAAISYLRSAQSSKGLRIGFVFNPPSDEPTQSIATGDLWVTRALHLLGHPSRVPAPKGSHRLSDPLIKYAEQMPARNFAFRLLRDALDVLNGSAVYAHLSQLSVSGVNVKSLEQVVQGVDRAEFLRLHANFSRHVLGLKPGERAIVANGRIIGPLSPEEEFSIDDFRLIERIALDSGAVQLADTLLELVGDELGGPDAVSELVWQMSPILNSKKQTQTSSVTDMDAVEGVLSRSRSRLDGLNFAHSGFQIPAEPGPPSFTVLAIVNPASRDTQRLSHVLIVLHQAISCSFKVLLNPTPSLSELPVKNFYRFVWEPSPFAFKSSGGVEVVSEDPVIPHAFFTHLPGQPLLTLGMDAPHGWMVAAVEAVYDLDNLRLADIHSTVEAVFELEYLLLEGHCFEEESMKPPRGLQLTLGPSTALDRYDTIVMANLGYFQLKAGPGAWYLNIRSGRSRDFYTFSDEQTESRLNSHELITNIDSFRSKIITVRVKKRPERAGENLLDESISTSTETKAGSSSWSHKHGDVWSTLSNYAENLSPSWLTSLRASLRAHLPWQTCPPRQEVINVFSLASGHLYERLLRIMMLTVLRHTKSPVKFWFLKNYLSPTFKDFIPHMAKEYGFDYELVQYQWPRWLHAQTEKQRIIWGYKILFLDVLFPLNVTKIIFVDADQIVRADLQELADLDLQGAPYGYTPFCDSRREMDGFRFWKQGYWANHLSGRPYHISALYVVDLTRFRQLAAGDRLRGQYHGLSQDPHSLSNLDQDLPNNMIHQVPIKSLPQEWLWCETWCSDESKSRAKTIDLCNNPLTKEPKLSAAMRIAPEWVDYDQEIKQLWKRVYPPAPRTPQTPAAPAVPEVPKQQAAAKTVPESSGQCTDNSQSTCPFSAPSLGRVPLQQTNADQNEEKSEL